ncbi:R3H domain-containing protein 1 isoform X9 [Hydra vulgaris]|uniref:R3H domain-containing protein 1 isoform X9 n=2 Tax=Hydra vulgaris TaxID=6087 RepID=A0ABM4CWM8_HYDVU
MQLKISSPDLTSCIGQFLDDSQKIEISKQKSMATFAQAPVFTSKLNQLENENQVILDNTCLPKFKSLQPTNNYLNASKVNSPRPMTTSEKHPPKLQNKSATVTNASSLNNKPEDGINEDLPINKYQDTNYTTSNGTDVEDKQSNVSVKHISTPSKQTSVEYSASPSSTASSLNRENSLDYKDSTGVDLHEFMVKTLRENPRDRLMLLKLEKEFTEFINDVPRTHFRYPPMTSYHRMLVHRVAAYFGLDHNIDSTGKCVVISKTPSSRIPEKRFQTYCSHEYTDEELSITPRAILIRSASEENSADSPEDASSTEERLSNQSNESYQTGESVQSEKEAAIAAVAAVFGNTKTSSTKRVQDRKNVSHLQLYQVPYGYQNSNGTLADHFSYASPAYMHNGESYNAPNITLPGGAIAINPQTVQPLINGDGSAAVFQTGAYPQQASSSTYTGANVYMQHSIQPPYVPVYVTNSQNGLQHYYVVPQPTPQYVYTPTQPLLDSPSALLSQVSYQSCANQLSNMSIENDETGKHPSQQVSSPPSPDPSSASHQFTVGGRQLYLVQTNPNGVYQQPSNLATIQYFPTTQPTAYAGYVNQYGQIVETPEIFNQATSQSPSPPVHPIQQQTYNTTQSPLGKPLPQSYRQTVYQPARVVPGVVGKQPVYLSLPGNQVFTPLSYNNVHIGQTTCSHRGQTFKKPDYYRKEENTNKYTYMQQCQHFPVLHSPAYNQIRPAGLHTKKVRSSRFQNHNSQQIRISRPNSNSSEVDQKTVNHILEIFDFPDTVSSDADAIFDEIKNAGARILKIKSSSSQQSNSNSQQSSAQRPTILAIFKSAAEAQLALETVTSPYYKLRVSQKSPTHFSGNVTDYYRSPSPVSNK